MSLDQKRARVFGVLCQIGGPLIIASATAVLFGADHPSGNLQGFRASSPILRAGAPA